MKTSSGLTGMTMIVTGPSIADQEVFLQHGLTIGRNAANTICIDEPGVERIHFACAAGAKTARCESNVRRTTPGLTLLDGSVAREIQLAGLDAGVPHRGALRSGAPSGQIESESWYQEGAWATRCPKCHNHLSERPKAAYKCPSCGAGLYFFTSTSGFEGFLPQRIGPYAVRAFVAEGGMESSCGL